MWSLSSIQFNTGYMFLSHFQPSLGLLPLCMTARQKRYLVMRKREQEKEREEGMGEQGQCCTG